MNAAEQTEAARRLTEALEIAGIRVHALKVQAGNVVGRNPVPAPQLLGAWLQRMWAVEIVEDRGARVVGSIGGGDDGMFLAEHAEAGSRRVDE